MRDAEDPRYEATLEAHGKALRALGRRLLGNGDADDLAQDALTAALTAAPSRAPLGAFLKGIARRLAAFRLRTRARREDREQLLARPEATVSAADAAATAELAQQVADAVRALPEPYRTTVVLRFWHDLPPRAIAAQLGVTVHTVRSRLQRALQMLRARLDARPSGRQGWALPLAAWIDVRPAAATTAAGGAAVLGGLVVMVTKVRVAMVVGCALVLALALAEHEVGDAAELAVPGGGAGIAVAAELPRAAGSVADPVERVAAPSVPVADLVPRATLRGRCVDASGAPLAGCEVVLRGDKASQERVDAWTLDHALPPAVEPAPVVTAADGRFAFSFAPPPPFQFVLEVRADGKAMLVARWSAIAPGRVVELGDLMMQPGLRLAGRVVDPQGLPVEDALVRARRAVDPSEPSPHAHGVVAPLVFAFAATDAAGLFAIDAPLLGGRYRLEVEKVGHRLRESSDGKPRPVSVLPPERGLDILIDVSAAQQGFELVLEPVPSAGAVSGTVLDASGAPVAGAHVQLTDATGSVAGAGATTAQGRFRVELWGPAERGPYRVRASCKGHEPCEPADPVAAGTTGLELRLGVGPVVTIRVAGPTGGTVDDYAVRMFRRGAGPVLDSNQVKVLARGPFADGTATVRGMPSGPWLAAVEFPGRLGLLPLLVPFDVAPGQSIRLDLVAETGAALEVAIRTQAGAPVPDARIALAQLVSGAFDERTEVVQFSTWNRTSVPNRALLLGEATTDAAGQATLQAPRGTELGLHVRAAGHVSLRQRGVVVTGVRRIELELLAEARLVGQLGPPAFLRQLAATAGPQLADHLQPYVRLVDDADRSVPGGFHAGGTNIDTDTRVRADGSFSIGALPAGRWRASLVWHPAVHAGGSGLPAGTLRTRVEAPLGTVELRAGATTQLDADLAQQVQGSVEATVFLDGMALANDRVQLDGPRGLVLETDAQGRGQLQLPPGRYRAVSSTHQLECAVDVAPDASGAARIVIAFVSGTIEATVRDAAGKPASGVHLLFRSGETSRGATSDAAGRVSKRLAPGTWEVSGCTGRWDPGREVRLGTVTVEAGATRTAEWVMPARRDG